MKLYSTTVLFLRHAFFVLLATCMLVLSSLLIGIVKQIEHYVHVFVEETNLQQNGFMGRVHKDCGVALILLIVMIVIMVVFSFSYILVMLSAGKREMHLCATLIKQMEATQQAERKSMNKSLAFATASHDVRAALAGITGLIEISYDEVSPGSDLETNLRQMDSCTKDLLGILNSILDTSKIEAGKMQLEEDEFDVAQLVEDAVDLYHPVGLKKGIDVVMDPHDGSIMKFSRVKGDRGRLKQILCNLISNAVKFTTEGHVTVRAWVEKPSFKNAIAASERSMGGMRQLLGVFNKKSKAEGDMETMKHDPNALEFVFEVDDTGRGIPKEKQKSVFENYVQVKETALGEGGTGLGLGIVQSLVRLMNGEIGIVDKEIGERGTCFKFNVLLTPSHAVENLSKAEDTEMGFVPSGASSDGRSSSQHLGIVGTHTPTPGPASHTISPRLNIQTPSPAGTGSGSSVVLLIKSEERRRVSKKFLESLGVKVVVAEQWQQLGHTLDKTRHNKGHHSRHQSSSGISELGLQDCLSKTGSCNSANRTKDVPLISAMDGTENSNNNNNNNILPLLKKTSHVRGASGFVLIVIDATAGPFQELSKTVSEFKMRIHSPQNNNNSSHWCRVVWLANHLLNLNNIEREEMFDTEDVIKYKPLHGSRLYEVVKLLPEFGGVLPKKKATYQPKENNIGKAVATLSSRFQQLHRSTTVDEPGILMGQDNRAGSSNEISPVVVVEDHQQRKGKVMSKPLRGKKFLVAEDSEVNRKLAMVNLTRLGASVELCENGRQALDLVRNALIHNQGKHGFDYILMDCEMPEMDGFEATRQIRREEESHNVHIPIIALTAHEAGEERRRRVEAGMDDHLSKPFNGDHLLQILRGIDSRRNK